MRKVMILSFAVIVVSAVLVAGASARRSATPVLTGTDGPGYTISLKLNGKTVKSLKAGAYKVVVHDKASLHGFTLTGPHGFAKSISSVAFVGMKTVTLKLKAGKYTFFCPLHSSVMTGNFAVK